MPLCSPTRSYLHLPGLIISQNPIGETHFRLSDGLGSVRQVLDSAERVVASDSEGKTTTDGRKERMNNLLKRVTRPSVPFINQL